MKSNTTTILKILHILSWIIFIGLCIKTGALLYSFVFSLVINSTGASNLYEGLDLSAVLSYDPRYYFGLVSLLITIAALKALILYFVIGIFRRINLVSPFSIPIAKLISLVSIVSIQIGMIILITNSYAKWLIKRGIELPPLGDYLSGASEYFLLGGIIFVIAQVFFRGVEIQNENELTV
jgi:hypothetical protein